MAAPLRRVRPLERGTSDVRIFSIETTGPNLAAGASIGRASPAFLPLRLAAVVVTFMRPLERVPIAWNHAIEKDSLQINELEHVLVGKPLHTFPGHALAPNRKPNR
jgi:hypothetical protein